MKKLLIIGGTQISLQILRAAKKKGLEVYVADYYEDSPCKKYADKSFSVSATDVDGIVSLIKQESIDGVLMGYADVLMQPYVEICEKSGLNCYATTHAIDITSHKNTFKDYCRLFGIPVVPEYAYDDVVSGRAAFPLIVKPVDNSGARGVYICDNLDDFKEKYAKAITFSPTQTVVIEKMMNSKEATVFYYLHDGEIYLLGVGDRWMYSQGNGLLNLPIGYTFPSKTIKHFIDGPDMAIRRMFASLGMKEGMVFMQCFVENGQYIVYEMGYRLTGSIEHHLMRTQYGFDHMSAMIDYAVGDSVDTSKLETLDPSSCCMANVTILLKEGIIKNYDGIETLRDLPGVVDFHVSYDAGAVIGEAQLGKLSQVGLRVLVMADDRTQLYDRMDAIKEHVRAYGDKGDDMFIKDYKYQNICQQ